MMRGFFNGDFLNPLDFPNWQPIGAMEAEDMFDFAPVDSSDPVNMLPAMPRQSAIQDPAQEAFQFPFQFPMQDMSGGEGKQYAPVDTPENILQEAGMTGMSVDENASETNETMSQQQSVMGDIDSSELWGDVARMMNPAGALPSDEGLPSTVEEMFGASAMEQTQQMMNPLGVSPADEGEIPQSVDRMFNMSSMGQAQQMMNPANELPSDENIPGSVEQMFGTSSMQQAQAMFNSAGELPSPEIPIPQTIESMYPTPTYDPSGEMREAQNMLNAQGVEQSNADIPGSVESMFGTTYQEQVARDKIYDPATYEVQEPENKDNDPMYDPDTYGTRNNFELDPSRSLLVNVWNALETESRTEDWGILGDILQNVNPSKSVLQNILDASKRERDASPVESNVSETSNAGVDVTAPSVSIGGIIEMIGADVLPKIAEVLKVIGL